MEPLGSAEIEVGLIQRAHDHEWREVLEHRPDRARCFRVVLEGALEERCLRAQADCFSDRHAGMNAETASAIRSGLYHSSLVAPATDNQKLQVAQFRMIVPADFDEEGIEIDMYDAGGHDGAYTRRIAVALKATITLVPAFSSMSSTD